MSGKSEDTSDDDPLELGWEDTAPEGFDALPPVPSYPIHCHAATERACAENLAAVMQVDWCFVGSMILAVLAIALQTKVEVHIRDRGWVEHAILWVLAVMGVGEKKSPTMEKLRSPFVIYENRLRQRILDENRSRKKRCRELQAKIKDAKGESSDALERELEENAPLPLPDLFVSDITPEALARVMHSNNGKAAVFDSEGTSVTGLYRYSKDGSTANLDTDLKAYSREQIIIHRAGADKPNIRIENPALSKGVCVQPSVVKEWGGRGDFVGQGFIARFQIVVPESKVGFRIIPPPVFDRTAHEAYTAKILRMCECETVDPIQLELSPEARDHFQAFEQEVENRMRADGDLGHIAGFANKSPGATLRIASMLHVSEFLELPEDEFAIDHGCSKPRTDHLDGIPMIISGPTMERACELGRWLVLSNVRAAAGWGSENRMEISKF